MSTDSEDSLGDNRYRPVRGMRDLNSESCTIIDYIKNIIVTQFKLYGATPLETPVIERELLVQNLYGEEFNKLVYRLEESKIDDPEEINKLFLRYDLTLSLARYLINNSISNLKRYTVGKVYRKDTPQIYKGRYREFYQCDFDIVGSDAGQYFQEREVLNLMCNVLEELFEDKFVIKINTRPLLYSILRKCQIPEELIISTCASIDNRDKLGEQFPSDLEKRGIPLESRIQLLSIIDALDPLDNEAKYKYCCTEGYEIDKLDTLLFDASINRYLNFDPFLARGLDYYTGLIYEACYIDSKIFSSSIAGGGRYDNLTADLGGPKIPIIGVSFGLDRIIDLYLLLKKTGSEAIPKVYVASVGPGVDSERMNICLTLRRAKFWAETNYWTAPKMRPQLDYVLSSNIPYMIIIGENEVASGTLNLKYIKESRQITIKREELLSYIN
jgi:histidyl-tRNA synthetase